MFSLPSCISVPLLFLCLLHVEQDAFMDTRYEPHLMQELCCNNLDIRTIISHVNQSIQIIISSETWRATHQNHKRRELRTSLDPTSVPKQDLGQVLVPRIHICRSRSQNSDAMLDGL